MKKTITFVALFLFCAAVMSAALPSSKAATQINTVTVCANDKTLLASNPCTDQTGEGYWFPVMAASLKTNAVSDLYMGVSLVTGLFTQTQVQTDMTNVGAMTEAVAEGTVRVAVQVVDGVKALSDLSKTTGPLSGGTFGFPDYQGAGITFDQRIQYMNANLGGIFTGCLPGTTGCTTTLQPQQITLALDSTAAHSFNYILPNIGTGDHTVVVWAKADTQNTSSKKTSQVNQANTYSNAMFGLGSLTVDSVRLVNSFSCDASTGICQ